MRDARSPSCHINHHFSREASSFSREESEFMYLKTDPAASAATFVTEKDREVHPRKPIKFIIFSTEFIIVWIANLRTAHHDGSLVISVTIRLISGLSRASPASPADGTSHITLKVVAVRLERSPSAAVGGAAPVMLFASP